MIVKEGYSVFLPCLKERRQKRLKVNYFFAVSSSSGGFRKHIEML